MTTDVSRVFADCSYCKGNTGVFGRFYSMQLPLIVNFLLHIGYNSVIVTAVVVCGHGCVASGKTDDCPFALYGVNNRVGDRRLQINLCLVVRRPPIRRVARRFACVQLLFCFQELLIRERTDLVFLLRGQCVVCRFGFVVLRTFSPRNRVGQGVNQCRNPGNLQLGDFRRCVGDPFPHSRADFGFCAKLGELIQRALRVCDDLLVRKCQVGRILRKLVCGGCYLRNSSKDRQSPIASHELVVVIFAETVLWTFAQRLIETICRFHVLRIRKRQLRGIRQTGNDCLQIFEITLNDNADGVPCRRAGFVHAGPTSFADTDVDDVTGRDLHTAATGVAAVLIIVIIEIHTRLIVLVRRFVGNRNSRLRLRNLQDIVRHAGGERSRRERTASDVQGFERRAGIAPRAAEISAERGRVHDVDVIAVLQRTIRGAEAVEALVHEPVVQRTHPTGVAAAGKLCKRAAVLLDRSQVGNGVVICATLPVILLALKCLENHGHHAVLIGQVIPAVDELTFQLSREGFTLERRVFDDHMDTANNICILERIVRADVAGFAVLILGRNRGHSVDRGFSCGGNVGCVVVRIVNSCQASVLCCDELCPVLSGIIRFVVGVELSQNSFLRCFSRLIERLCLCPGDRDRYILIGHGKGLQTRPELNIDPLIVLAFVLLAVAVKVGVVDRQ